MFLCKQSWNTKTCLHKFVRREIHTLQILYAFKTDLQQYYFTQDPTLYNVLSRHLVSNISITSYTWNLWVGRLEKPHARDGWQGQKVWSHRSGAQLGAEKGLRLEYAADKGTGIFTVFLSSSSQQAHFHQKGAGFSASLWQRPFNPGWCLA